LRFEVYKNGELCDTFTLAGAYLFGADTIPLHATEQIRFSGGRIECKRRSHDAAGLALVWPVEGMGHILLPTTRLPERDRPYVLNVELARAKLMQITLKREDWSLFDEEAGLSTLSQEVRELFIGALEQIGDPGKAARIADEALSKAVAYAEQLAAHQAEQAFTARCGNHSLGRHSLGCRVDPSLIDDEAYCQWLFDMFGFVTLPIDWATIEPEQGRYAFDLLDHCLERLASKRLAICAGPVLHFAERSLPKWLLESGWPFEKIREAAYGFVSRVVGRYKRLVHAWRVISGMNAANHFGFSFEQAIEMTRTATLAARSADTKSRKVVELLYPWGEYYAHDRNTIPPLVYADMVIQSGISFDAFGLEVHFGKDRPGMHVRDMMQVSARLDCFAQVAKPVHITGVAVPDRLDGTDGEPERAGAWHRPWDAEMQGQWVEQFYRIALGKPFVQSVTYSYLADPSCEEVPGGGLLSARYEPKHALLALARLQKAIGRK